MKVIVLCSAVSRPTVCRLNKNFCCCTCDCREDCLTDFSHGGRIGIRPCTPGDDDGCEFMDTIQ